eukprot:6193004-Pleurochrysis_carterae.AAC.3
MGLQTQTERRPQGSTLRSGVRTDCRRRLRADILRDDAHNIPTNPSIPRGSAPTLHEAVGLCRRLPPRRVGTGRGTVVYCRPPPCYETIGADGGRRVCRVVKPAYGMAQAGRQWQRSLFPWLKVWGFRQSASDPCVFVCDKHVQGCRQTLILGYCVDDFFTV